MCACNVHIRGFGYYCASLLCAQRVFFAAKYYKKVGDRGREEWADFSGESSLTAIATALFAPTVQFTLRLCTRTFGSLLCVLRLTLYISI